MPVCSIVTVDNPTGSSSFSTGDSFTVEWDHNSTFVCAGWRVEEIKLQYYNGSTWSDTSTLWTGSHSVSGGGEGISVTLANSYSNYGDAYRVRVKYEEAPF